MMIEPTSKKTLSWLKIIAALIALLGVGFALFLKTKMPPPAPKNENTQQAPAK